MSEPRLDPFDEAAAAAIAELDPTESSEPVEDLSSDDEEVEAADGQAESVEVEQPEAAPEGEVEGEEIEEIFDPEATDEDEAGDELDFENTLVQLPGVDGPVSLQEMANGYLRHGDYTKKTQEVADERKAVEAEREGLGQAAALWSALQDRPLDVIRQLAVQAKLMDGDAKAAGAIEFSPFKTAEDVNAEIDRRVEEKLASHPSVQEASLMRAEKWIGESFSNIETTYEIQLGPNSRKAVLKEAARIGTDDLEVAYSSLATRQKAKKGNAAALKGAAPSRPTGGGGKSADVKPVTSIEDAFEQASIELGING